MYDSKDQKSYYDDDILRIVSTSNNQFSPKKFILKLSDDKADLLISSIPFEKYVDNNQQTIKLENDLVSMLVMKLQYSNNKLDNTLNINLRYFKNEKINGQFELSIKSLSDTDIEAIKTFYKEKVKTIQI